MTNSLEPLLKRLHLANARRTWRELVERAEKEEWTYEALLLTLFEEEVAHRRGTRLARAVRSASFPFLRTIEEFDFSFQSTLRLTTIGSLLAPDFITEGGSVILEGKPGRGKTHLAIAIAYRALQNGFDVLFTTAADLIDDLSAAGRDGRLRDALVRYVKPHLLVVDEVGYLTYGNDAANVLFHVVNERHINQRAMLFTTNKHPRHWGKVLHDDDLADAIVDRILHRGRLLRLDGPSVRTKHLPDGGLADPDHDESSSIFSGIRDAEFPEPTDGARVLTDPVWSDRASPFRLAGPKRFQPAPVPISTLPRLDAVIVSHDHYDHLDFDSIVELAKRNVPFVTSLGVGAHLESWGVPLERIVELDWWEHYRAPGTEIVVTAAPSQHFSGRGVGDRNTTLWSSFVVQGTRHSCFFSGDTGLTPEYGEIRRRLGPFDLVMLEVGAFHPAWSDIHLGPDNAIEALSLLGGGALLPVHWGTFNLALHAWDQPAERLLEIAPRAGARVLMPMLGDPVEPARSTRIDAWWRQLGRMPESLPEQSRSRLVGT